MATTIALAEAILPRVTIRFCTQCKWNLRAAYFAQELLQTFGTALGEVALQPSGGGIFVVEIFYASPQDQEAQSEAKAVDTKPEIKVQRHVLWDRKVDGGFPETKILKRRVRDIIEPNRDLGHVDRHNKGAVDEKASTAALEDTNAKQEKNEPTGKNSTGPGDAKEGSVRKTVECEDFKKVKTLF